MTVQAAGKTNGPLCRVCSDASLAPLYEVAGCPIVRCRACGLTQVADVATIAKVEEIYDSRYFGRGKYRDDAAGRKEQQRRLDLIARGGLAPGAKLLDFGAATGEFVAAARPRYDVWGVDVSPEAIAMARQGLPGMEDRLHAATAERLPFADGFFDAVVMWDVIEHLPYPRQALRAILRTLKPGGLLAISTPNIGAPLARVLSRRWHFMTPPEHLVLFDRPRLEALLERVGVQPNGWRSFGKWANVGFLVGKAARSYPEILGPRITERIARSRVADACVYVPTGDVQYITGVYDGRPR